MKIVLKSASPRRYDLLKSKGFDFEVKVYDIDETMDKNKTPYENVKELGLKKALINQELDYGKILIGCDTIVVLDDCIYGKPVDRQDAYRMLRSLSGRHHEVMSGVGIIYKEKIYNFVNVSKVYFKELSDKDIYDYIDSGECFGKAGSYAIQGIGNRLVDHFEGSLENIIGMPIDEVVEIIGEIYEMEN
jgi:septum formation protein